MRRVPDPRSSLLAVSTTCLMRGKIRFCHCLSAARCRPASCSMVWRSTAACFSARSFSAAARSLAAASRRWNCSVIAESFPLLASVRCAYEGVPKRSASYGPRTRKEESLNTGSIYLSLNIGEKAARHRLLGDERHRIPRAIRWFCRSAQANEIAGCYIGEARRDKKRQARGGLPCDEL